MQPKTILFVSRKPPYGNSRAAELLDAVLITAAFDQEVHLAFLDDGVFQLVKYQQADAVGHKAFAESFRELGEYDIEHIWVEQESLAERGLSEHDLLIAVSLVSRAEMAQVMAKAAIVMSA